MPYRFTQPDVDVTDEAAQLICRYINGEWFLTATVSAVDSSGLPFSRSIPDVALSSIAGNDTPRSGTAFLNWLGKKALAAMGGTSV